VSRRVSTSFLASVLADSPLTRGLEVCCAGGWRGYVRVQSLGWGVRHRRRDPHAGSQDHFHLRIRTLRHACRCRKMSPEAAEPLLLMHHMRMRVILALRARCERSRSCSVGAREHSWPSGVVCRIARLRGLRPKASIQCLFRHLLGPYFALTSTIGFTFKVQILGARGS
jgi:hypothetical protein